MRYSSEHIGRGFELLWFSEIQWDYLVTRKQHLLERFPEEWRILFIEPFTLGRRQHWFPVRRGRVTVVTVPFVKNVPPGMVQLFDVAPFRWLVTVAGRLLAGFWCRVLGFASPGRVIGLSNIYWGGVAASMPARLRFYDANDDHPEFTAGQSWLHKAMRRYLDACDLVFYVSDELREKLRLHPGQCAVALGNGVGFSHFAEPRQAPALMEHLPKPVIGYAGALDWLDTGLLESVASAWPECSLLLVGPVYDREWKSRHAALLSMQNVHCVGKVSYDELPAWVQHFDLALIPFESSALIRSAHPNKLYEYTAAGVPVLAIDYCRAVRAARHVVHVASNPGEFVRMVPEAMADPRKGARQAFAREHGWEQIAASMVRELRNAIDRRAK